MTVDEIIKHCDDYITSMNKYADTGNIGWWLEFYHTVLNGFRELKALEAQPTHGSTYGGVSWGGIYKEEAQPTDAVSREAVEEITFQEPSYTDPYNILTEVREKVRALKPVQPQRKRGKWIDVDDNDSHGWGAYKSHVCSECKDYYTTSAYEMKYCPNCGSYNGGEEDEDSD